MKGEKIVQDGVAYVDEHTLMLVAKELEAREISFEQNPIGPVDGETSRWGQIGVDETVFAICVNPNKSQLLRSLVVRAKAQEMSD